MINKVMKLVREAARFCKVSDLKIESKGGNSNFVTTADVAVERFMKENLPGLIKGSRMVGEEGDAEDVNAEYLWVVDPIDGTANFIRKFNLSAISVGLLHNGEPVLGVIYNPFTNEMYYGEKGKGAFLNGVPMKVSGRDYAHSVFCTAFSLYNKTLAEPCFKILERVYPEIDDMRRLGTASLELANLAAGKCELYFEIRICSWDVTAALALLLEAGGDFEIPGRGKKIPLYEPFPIIAANNRENFEKLKTVVEEELKKGGCL